MVEWKNQAAIVKTSSWNSCFFPIFFHINLFSSSGYAQIVQKISIFIYTRFQVTHLFSYFCRVPKIVHLKKCAKYILKSFRLHFSNKMESFKPCFSDNKRAQGFNTRCRVHELNRRVCLFSELVTGVTVPMVAQQYASGTRKRKVRRSIVIKLLQDWGRKQCVAIRKISIEGDPEIF